MFKPLLLKRKGLTHVFWVLLYCVLIMNISSVAAQFDDPMRPPGYRIFKPGQKSVSLARRYTLSFVRISSSRRSAIINDRLVEIGNRVSGARVIAIYPSSVKLKKKGKVFTIKILSKSIKKTIPR